MKRTIKSGATPPDFDAQKLFDKAQLFAERMFRPGVDEAERALWSALALELLARAALANISPALLADPSKDSNLDFALGLPIKDAKFSATSIGAEKVFRRLNGLVAEFIEEDREFCVGHTGKRNAEVHSGRSPFNDIEHWEGKYFKSVDVLLKTMGFELADFIGDEQAEIASKESAAQADKAAQAVKGDVAAATKKWSALPKGQQKRKQEESALWATRQAGHRVDCPACKSQALVVGEPAAQPERTIDGETITEIQLMLPHKFQCIACGLKIAGLARLIAVGLGKRYKKTEVFDGYELFARDEPDGSWDYGDDNNEPV